MAWFYLIIASLFEIGWPVGLKFADVTHFKFFWIIFSVVTMLLSGYFLFLAQKQIPIGIAYAIWTSIGILGTFSLGILLFHDTITPLKILGVFLILTGVIVLKLSV